MMTMGSKLIDQLKFKDDMARSVVVLGFPTPLLLEPEVRHRMESYIQSAIELQKMNRDTATQEFVIIEASRTVNRLLTLPVKHINDFGAMLMIGKEYEDPQFAKHLSSWAWKNIR